jgi:hypothetical protein
MKIKKIKVGDGSKYRPTTPPIIEIVPDEGDRKTIGTGRILHANADKMVVDFTDKWWDVLVKVWAPAFWLIYLPFVIMNNIANDKFYIEVYLYFHIPLSIICLGLAIKFLYRPKRIVTFNRQEGTLDVPDAGIKGWSGKRTIKLQLDLLFMPFAGPYTKTVVIAYQEHQFKHVETGISAHSYQSAFSFIFWYMDKNRPLPPGAIFDPYRQTDFERRRAQGFPLPLFLSRIPTIEATPEQQRERDKVWPKNLAGIVKNKK